MKDGNRTHHLLSTIAVLFISVPVMAAQPEWAKQDTLKRKGTQLRIVCSGSGPSLDQARKSALDSCRLTAIDNFNTSVNVHSLSIETEHETAFHSEVSSHMQATGLLCDVEKEASEEKDGSFLDYIKCNFDLSHAKIVAVPEKNLLETNTASEVSSNIINANAQVISAPSDKGVIQKIQDSHGENKQLVVTSIPACDEILIRGERPRSAKCSENPVTLYIYPSDKELIVRAMGRTPKHVLLNEKRTPAGDLTQTLQVYLEEM